jgi:hypothetical protein
MFARSTQLPGTRRSTLARLLGGTATLVTVGSFLSVPVAGAATAAWCAPSGVLVAADLPAEVSPADCDLSGRTLAAGSVRVDVPTPGHGVSAADRGTGGESSLRVFTDATGVVTISQGDAEDAAPTPVGAAALGAPKTVVGLAAACRDSNYAGMGYKFTGTFVWYRNNAGTPKNIAAAAGTAIAQATADVTRGSNRCGFTRPVRLGQRLAGSTTRKPQITAAGSCYSAGDGVSVTGWMKLPKVLAYTCSYYRKLNGKWVVSESDMALSNSFSWFTSSVPRGCRYTFDLRGVVAHERGHTFGLGHVGKTSTLTMAPFSQPCTTANRSLGYGDYRGLSTMYGVA